MMANLLLHFATFLLLLLQNQSESLLLNQDQCFRASVYEHVEQGRILNVTQPDEVIDYNLQVYERMIKLASKKASLIISIVHSRLM